MKKPDFRPCGCTYRGLPVLMSEQEAADLAALIMFYINGSTSETWARLCVLLRANTDDKRDALHHVLHLIGTPEITPTRGPGRRGTRWTLGKVGE